MVDEEKTSPASLKAELAEVMRSTRAVRPERSNGRRLKRVALLTRQLSVLVRTGTPLAQALDAMRRQLPPGPWRDVVADLNSQIEQGTGLSDAMERHPAYFNAVCRSLVAAGETSGKLGAMLDRLSHLTRQQLRIRRSLSGAMIYPVLLLFVGIGVVTIMIAFVLPRFEDLFASFDAPLPPSTQILLSVSDLLREYWWALGGSALVTGFTLKFVLSTPSGKRGLDVLLVKLPYVGHLVRSLVTASITRLLGVLLDSHVPMLDTLRLVQRAAGNSLYSDLIGAAQEAVVRGESLSSVFMESSLVSPYVAEAIRHGEESGQLSPVLLDMAEFLDEENDTVVKTAARLLEPIMLILLGLVVGVIALSIFVPLFDLTSLTQGG